MAASHQSSAGDVPRCQVPGCDEALPEDAAYYKRNKICRYHFSLLTHVLDGRRVRWCQQCTKFQDIADYDGNKRSCREALLRHNSRRRKRAGGAGEEQRQRRVRRAPSSRSDTSPEEDGEVPKAPARRHPEPSPQGPMQAQGGEEEQQHSMQLAEPPHCAASACALHSPQPVAAPWADSRWVGGALQQQPPAAGAQPSAAAGAAASLLQEPQLSQAIATPDDSLLGGLGLDFCDMQLPELTTPWAGCTAASWEGSDLRRHTCSLSLQSRQSVQLQPPAAPGQPFQGLAAGQAAGLARACSPLDPAPGPFYEAQPGGCAPQLQTPPADAGRRQYQQHQQQQPAICHSLFMEQAAVPVPTPLPVPASGVEFPEQWRGGAPACSSQHQQERQQQQRAPPHRWGRPQQRQQQQQPWAQLDSRRELPELPHRSCRLAEPPARTGLTAHSALLGGRRDPTAMAGATLWSPFLPSAGQGECDRGTPWRAGAGAAALPAPSRGTPARAPPPASQGAALGSPRSCLLPSPASQLPSLPLSFQLGGLAAEGSRLLGSVESLEDLPPHLLTKMQSIGIALLDLVQHATSALGAEVTSAARPPAEHPPQQPQQPPAATCCLQAAAAASALPWLSGGGGLLELVGQANGRTGSSSGQPAGLASSWSCLPAQPPLPAHAAGSDGGSQLAGLMPHVLGPPQQAQQDRALAPPLGLQSYQLMMASPQGW